MKLTDRTRDLILRWLLLAAYAAATLVLVLRHEPWADELQAWLIARDSTVPEIFAAMKWEGHFVPWYLMLHVFAANGAPVLCMNLLSWAFLTAAGAFFIFRAPFNLPIKALVLCSSGMLFWYPVVARGVGSKARRAGRAGSGSGHNTARPRGTRRASRRSTARAL